MAASKAEFARYVQLLRSEIQKFEMEGKDEAFDPWFRKFVEVTNTLRMHNSDVVRILPLFLGETAVIRFNKIQAENTPIKNWNNFSKALLQGFQNKWKQNCAMEELEEIVQGRDSLEEFCGKIRKKAQFAYQGRDQKEVSQEAARHFLRGLNSDLRSKVRLLTVLQTSNPESLEVALQLAQNIEIIVLKENLEKVEQAEKVNFVRMQDKLEQMHLREKEYGENQDDRREESDDEEEDSEEDSDESSDDSDEEFDEECDEQDEECEDEDEDESESEGRPQHFGHYGGSWQQQCFQANENRGNGFYPCSGGTFFNPNQNHGARESGYFAYPNQGINQVHYHGYPPQTLPPQEQSNNLGEADFANQRPCGLRPHVPYYTTVLCLALVFLTGFGSCQLTSGTHEGGTNFALTQNLAFIHIESQFEIEYLQKGAHDEPIRPVTEKLCESVKHNRSCLIKSMKSQSNETVPSNVAKVICYNFQGRLTVKT